MLLLIKNNTPMNEIEALVEKLTWMGFNAKISSSNGRFAIAVVHGDDDLVNKEAFKRFSIVESISQFSQAFKLAAKEFNQENSIFEIKGKKIGKEHFQIMAGPCSIESEKQIFDSAEMVAKSGAKILRGGAFKPRTSPYSFQGMGKEGLVMMREAADKYDLLTVSEVMDGDQIELCSEYVDILQVGARNMQNFSLLKKLGDVRKPILLKRGLSATYKDLLMSAEYILSRGNSQVILCERGIRTYETYSRNTLDLAAVPILHELSHLPVVVDPSHGTGIRSMVSPMAYAAIACGADGVMLETHPRPDEALSDKEQTIGPEQFIETMQNLRKIAPVVGKIIE